MTELEEWDAEWQSIYDRYVAEGRTPNASVWRAYGLMEARGRGPRPEPQDIGEAS